MTTLEAIDRTLADARDRGRNPVVDDIITRLAEPKLEVYQRAGTLVHITREAREIKNGKQSMFIPAGTPTIRLLPAARLREIIGMTHGPKSTSYATEVLERGEWHDVRPLDAVTTYPIMRGDGSLLLESGYDSATRTLATIDVQVDVPEKPTHADALRALGMLIDLVSNFPFCSANAFGSWLAMLLTVPARSAIDGPTPLGLLEASQSRSGKTLLADVISTITTGKSAPVQTAPTNEEEWRKALFATLLAGAPIVFLDNVKGMLSSAALEAVLTSTTYKERILGLTEERSVAVRAVFLASANNCRLSTDLVGRTVTCRLEPNVERPEARTGFKHPDLLRHVREHRAELLGAALTILRAYVVAGRPRVEARPMGRFEAWSRVVRDAIVWVGVPDPVETQDDLRETADVERDEVRELLTAWHAVFGDKPVTLRKVIEASSGAKDMAHRRALADALRSNTPIGVEPTALVVGNKLRKIRGQVAEGFALQTGPRDNANVATWRVVRVEAAGE